MGQIGIKLFVAFLLATVITCEEGRLLDQLKAFYKSLYASPSLPSQNYLEEEEPYLEKSSKIPHDYESVENEDSYIDKIPGADKYRSKDVLNSIFGSPEERKSLLIKQRRNLFKENPISEHAQTIVGGSKGHKRPCDCHINEFGHYNQHIFGDKLDHHRHRQIYKQDATQLPRPMPAKYLGNKLMRLNDGNNPISYNEAFLMSLYRDDRDIFKRYHTKDHRTKDPHNWVQTERYHTIKDTASELFEDEDDIDDVSESSEYLDKMIKSRSKFVPVGWLPHSKKKLKNSKN